MEDPCSGVENLKTKISCYKDLAESRLDLSICDKISPEGNLDVTKESCIRIVAIKKNDPSICNKITDAEKKKGCVSDVNILGREQ